MKVELMRQYSVFMPNRPGALANMAKLFADKGVNIIGIASEVNDASGLVRLAIEGPEENFYILSKAGFSCVESRILSVVLEDKPGQLYKITRLLADGGVNITTVYGTALRNQISRIMIGVDNAKKALEILQRAQ